MSDEKAEIIVDGKPCKGRILQAGEVLQATDYYLDSAGGYKSAKLFALQRVEKNTGAKYVRLYDDPTQWPEESDNV